MKTSHVLTLTLALAALTSARADAGPPKFTVAIDGDSAAITETYRTLGDAHLALGATRDEVVYALGDPSFKLTPNGWVYYHVHANRSGQAKPRYCALVVVFNERGVISYRLVDEQILAVLINDARHVPTDAPTAFVVHNP
jgi:outer membrane protein assembly factor BamE (lipoprotein component of BamABCDE complex)